MQCNNCNFIREAGGNYQVLGKESEVSLGEETILAMARDVCEHRLARQADRLTSPDHMREILVPQYAPLESEVFAVLFMDTRHRLIAHEVLFTGTIDGASVYPREVAKRALQLNAAACVFVHNHPSGIPEPSSADINLTDRLKSALGVLEIRCLDHIVIGGLEAVSMAERGHM